MTNRSTAAAVATVAAAAVLLGAVVQLQAARDRLYPPAEETDDAALYLRSGSAVRRLTGAYTTLFADVYAKMPWHLEEQMRHALAMGEGQKFEGAFPL